MAAEPSPWGWGRPQRALLAALVVAWAVGLLIFGRPGGAPAIPPPASVVVDVNTAPRPVLLALPGLGPTRVDRIVAARAERPFESLDDLAGRVKGIGPATIEGLRPFVRIGPPKGTEPDRGL